MQKKIASIETARGLAAFLVLLFHATEGMQKLFDEAVFGSFFLLGRSGVDLFFVLSGFIILYVHYPDIGVPTSLSRYCWRRFARIYPPYWIGCLLVLGIYILQGRVNGNEFDIGSILNSFFLLPSEKRSLLVVSWTLNYEVFFYFLFGWLIFNRRIGYFLFGFWAFAIIMTNLFNLELSSPLAYLHNSRNLEFFFGMGAVFLLRRISFKNPLMLSGLGLLLFMGVSYADAFSSFLRGQSIFYGIAAGLLLIGMVTYETENNFKIPKGLLLLGAASYSIYLTHVPALLLFFKVAEKLNLAALSSYFLFFLSVGFALLSGFCFYIIVEKPLKKLSHYYSFKTA